MSTTADAHPQHEHATRGADSVTPITATLGVIGMLMAIFGVYWDDAWHTDRGRDSTLSAPHLALYAGVALAVGVVGWWGWQRRSAGWRTILSGPIGVAVVGALVTLGSAPVDGWWHEAFGRDAVLWSPPHMIALIGTIALGTGILMVAGKSAATMGQRSAVALSVAAGAGVLGGWQVLVLEYDTDVAQFSPLWYLPVLAAGLMAATLTVQASLPDRLPWPAAWVGVAYTAAMAIVIVALWSMDYSRPIVPATIPALMAADLARRRGWSVLVRSCTFVAALFVVYLPYLQVVAGGVSPSTGEAAAGALLALIAVAITTFVFDPATRGLVPGGPALATAAVVATAVFFVAGSSPALAHDPGQGIEVTTVTLTAEVTDQRVELTVDLGEIDPEVQPQRLVARRAGRVVEGTLAAGDDIWTGQIQLDESGRWFVYVEASRGDEILEAWLPVDLGGEGVVSKRTELYVVLNAGGTTASQIFVGGVLAVLSLAIVGRIAWTVRATAVGPVGPPDKVGARRINAAGG
jgi:uncharacterized Zn-binding protein involved in type VI secretion